MYWLWNYSINKRPYKQITLVCQIHAVQTSECAHKHKRELIKNWMFDIDFIYWEAFTTVVVAVVFFPSATLGHDSTLFTLCASSQSLSNHTTLPREATSPRRIQTKMNSDVRLFLRKHWFFSGPFENRGGDQAEDWGREGGDKGEREEVETVERQK